MKRKLIHNPVKIDVMPIKVRDFRLANFQWRDLSFGSVYTYIEWYRNLPYSRNPHITASKIFIASFNHGSLRDVRIWHCTFCTFFTLFQADSGGPLMVGNYPTGGPVMVIGVVSTGIGCSRIRLPGIYTRVSDYVSWITQEIQSGRWWKEVRIRAFISILNFLTIRTNSTRINDWNNYLKLAIIFSQTYQYNTNYPEPLIW